ncbi:hypothetical protein ABLN64_17165, partial [Mycobacterium tuberculosis]
LYFVRLSISGVYSERLPYSCEFSHLSLKRFRVFRAPLHISLTTKGTDAITDYLATDAAADRVSAAVDTVLRVIEGFEGPYGVELLASTHWVATREGAKEPATAAAAVRKWTKRKGRIYSDDRIGVALDRILMTA